MTRVQAAVARGCASFGPLGSPNSLSWPVLAIYCPIGVIIQASGNPSFFGGPPPAWLAASLLSMISLIGLVAGVRIVARRRAHPNPCLVLATYALAVLIQGVAFGVASVALGAASDPHLSFRVTGAVFVQLPLIVVVGYAVSRYAAHHRLVADLQITRDRLVNLAQRSDLQLDQAEADLAIAVRGSLEPAISSLDDVLADAAGEESKAGVVDAIDRVVEQQLRPLARELASREAEALGEQMAGAGRPSVRIPLPSTFQLADAIRPGLSAAVFAIASLSSGIRALAPESAVIYVVAVPACAAALLAIARRLLGRARVRVALGVPVMVLLYGGVGFCAFSLIGAAGVPRPEGVALPASVFSALIGFAIVADLLVQSRRERTASELEVETRRLRENLSLIRRRERLVARRLAFVVHGALQGALHAAAIRIAQAEAITEQLGAEVRRDLSEAFSQVDGRLALNGSLRTTATVDELTAVWTLHRGFDARFGESVEELLAVDPEADEAVAEVIREAVNNAFRHGAAKRVEVEIGVAGHSASRPPNEAEFLICVRDDGIGYSGEAQSGLGTVLFDDLCSAWTIGTDKRGTLFEARIASGTAGEIGTGMLSVAKALTIS